MTPETKARLDIDKKLILAGYTVQDWKDFNPTVSLGIAVREFPTESGPVDYMLFIEKGPVGVIEAKATNKGETLTCVAEQTMRYANSGLKYYKEQPIIRFAYETTDVLTHFCDYADEKYRSRDVFSFHRPEELLAIIKRGETLRNNLKNFPLFDSTGFRQCQTDAICNLENSFAQNKPRALIQMATGAGKTYTAITSVYRLLKFAHAKRILFLVDTKNLGEQAEEEFRRYKPTDDARLFPELYNVKRLNSSYIPNDTHVCISTIQRMYSILRGEELDESAEEESMNEQKIVGRPKEVAYNEKYPIEFFDFIIIDECHRSIYNLWQQVLDYFDSFLIGLTATPDKRTFGFFHENIVSEYTHEQAVIDDVNVGREGTYIIETEISKKGSQILQQVVEKRNRLSRKKRWEQLDEDMAYQPSQLDKDVVNPSQIRKVLSTFKDIAFTQLFPNRQELPKTLIFAKTDSHADDIIQITREIFNEGNEFCKKITYGSTEDPKSILTAFRNDYYPRVAVTVDMIATGTDVKAIECLIFMRDVRSKNYFEQMLGRATRTLGKDDLQKVSPSAKERKLGYILIDAVGVTKSKKTTSRQLDRKPGVSLKDLLTSVTLGAHDEDTLTTLSSRLLSLDKVLTDGEKNTVETISKGISLRTIAQNCLNSFDEDILEQSKETQEDLISKAIEPLYNPELRNFVITVRKAHDQIIDNVNIDTLSFSGWDTDQEAKADETIATFRQFIEKNKDEITALNIIYSQSYKNRPLTLTMIEQLYESLKQSPYKLSIEKLWAAYSIKDSSRVAKRVEQKLADIVCLIRYELGYTKDLNVFSANINVNFMKWTMGKNAGNEHFTEEQMQWLRMIRDHIAISLHIDEDDLEYTPFDTNGGLGKFYQLFGANYQALLEEMNVVLVA